MATGFIEKPDIPASSGARIVCANGVYKASKGGVSGFGESAEEALFKLSQRLTEDLEKDLAELDAPTVGEEADKVLNVLGDEAQQDMQPEMQNKAGMEPALEPVAMPSMEQAGPVEMAAPAEQVSPMDQITPTTPEVPVDAIPPVPDEIEGGKTEFALTGEGWHPDAEMAIGQDEDIEGVSDEQEDFVEPMMEMTAAKKKYKPHVDAAELDGHLAEESASKHPADTQEIELQCQNSGA
jgi:hypothetical protein